MRAVHNAADINYRSPFGAVPAGKTVLLAVDSDEKPALRLWIDGKELILSPKSVRTGENGLSRYEFDYTPDSPGIIWYRFLFDSASLAPGSDPLLGEISGRDAYESFQLTVYSPDFSVPQWTVGRVMYQIFPDRFARDPSVPKVPGRVYHSRWDDPITIAPLPGKDEYTAYDFYGGNFRGIESRLDYLSLLGVTALYINPVYRAVSNHRYDVGDYTMPDPLLGTPEDYESLCAQALRRDIRILADGVFSHTGDESIYFDRSGNEAVPGAYRDKSSPYFGWYRFRSWPDDYGCWWGVKSLPEVDEENPSFSEFINGENGVARLWLRRGASGWRLDVADELPDSFLESFRRAAKAEKDAFIVGEVWEDATNKVSYGKLRRYLLGEQLDSVMNYPFRRWTIDLLTGKLSAAGFAANLRALLSNYPPPCINSLMNFLSTHDTPRITSILGGMPEDISRARAQDFVLSPAARRLALRRHALAAALLFTLPGIPCIYYGDELALEGGPDPLNRRTFPAEGFDTEQPLHRLYSELAALRKNPALARGETKVSSRGSTLFLERAFKNERAELTLDTQSLEAKLALGEKELFIP